MDSPRPSHANRQLAVDFGLTANQISQILGLGRDFTDKQICKLYQISETALKRIRREGMLAVQVRLREEVPMVVLKPIRKARKEPRGGILWIDQEEFVQTALQALKKRRTISEAQLIEDLLAIYTKINSKQIVRNVRVLKREHLLAETGKVMEVPGGYALIRKNQKFHLREPLS